MLLSLPTELLLHILSFLTVARDMVKLRYVSRRLQSVTKTPSLWREFVWPYYHVSDEGCVNNVLRVCGQHVKKMSFPHHVTPSKLMKMIEYCKNVVHLDLPTTNLYLEQLKIAMSPLRQLQTLDVQWDSNVKGLLVELVELDLNELTVRVKLNQSSLNSASEFCRSVGSWVQYWASKQYIPRILNIIVVEFKYIYPSEGMIENALLKEWYKTKSNFPVGNTGCLKLYSTFKKQLVMNLAPILPIFQLEYGQSSSLPYVSAANCGLPGLDKDLLLLTDCTCNGRVVYKAVSKLNIKNIEINKINTLGFVTEFDVSYLSNLGVNFEHLEKLSVVCPNLQRLNLKSSIHCLKSLHGLRAIANSCHNLQGLNLLGIPVEEVENQMQLWEILSDMKLTHLAVELCVLLPLDKNDKMKSLFQKCAGLYALESTAAVHCRQCSESFTDNSLSILFSFPLLTHFIHFSFYHRSTTFVQDIINSCKNLRYLKITQNVNITSQHFILSVPNCRLEQLCVASYVVDLPDNFMSSVSAHGGLVHVVLYVRSVTSEGITRLVMNSPNLMTLHTYLESEVVKDIEDTLRAKLPHRRLFRGGSYKLVDHIYMAQHKYEHHTDLMSFWN